MPSVLRKAGDLLKAQPPVDLRGPTREKQGVENVADELHGLDAIDLCSHKGMHWWDLL